MNGNFELFLDCTYDAMVERLRERADRYLPGAFFDPNRAERWDDYEPAKWWQARDGSR